MNMVSGGAVEKYADVENLGNAIKWALENKRKMNDADKKALTASLIYKKNRGYWNEREKFPDNISMQPAYSSANKAVNLLADLVMYYLDNSKCCLLGSHGLVSFGFMKRAIYLLLHGNESRQPEVTAEEDGWQEHLSLK